MRKLSRFVQPIGSDFSCKFPLLYKYGRPSKGGIGGTQVAKSEEGWLTRLIENSHGRAYTREVKIREKTVSWYTQWVVYVG